MGEGVLDLTVIEGLRDLGSMSSDGQERIRQLVITFIDDAQARAAALSAAAAQHHAADLRALSHSLAGSSASLGAQVVAAICRQIEAKARGGDVTDVALDVERLHQALADAGDALRVALVDPGPPGSTG